MRHLLNQLSLMLSAVFLVSCASAIPPARIGDYVSPEHQAGDEALTRINQRPLQAGLVVVSDTAEPGAAPNLPEEALTRLGESLQQDLGRAIPVSIKEIIPADHIRPQPHGDWAQFAELGRQRRLDYLAVVVVSSTEQEYPLTLFLGWTTHAQPGLRRDNWSLAGICPVGLEKQSDLAAGRRTGLGHTGSSDRARDRSMVSGNLPAPSGSAAYLASDLRGRAEYAACCVV